MQEMLYDEGTSTYGMRDGYRLRVAVDEDAHAFSPLTWNDWETKDGWAYRQWAAGRVYVVLAEREVVYVNRDDDRDTTSLWEVVDSLGDCYLTPGEDEEGITRYAALDVAREYGFEGVAPVFTADDIGCHLDGAHGWHNHYRAVDLAVHHGMGLSKQDREDLEAYRRDQGMHCDDPDGVPGAIIDQGGLVDRATEHLDSITDEGLSWEWDMGELSLVRIQDDED